MVSPETVTSLPVAAMPGDLAGVRAAAAPRVATLSPSAICSCDGDAAVGERRRCTAWSELTQAVRPADRLGQAAGRSRRSPAATTSSITSLLPFHGSSNRRRTMQLCVRHGRSFRSPTPTDLEGRERRERRLLRATSADLEPRPAIVPPSNTVPRLYCLVDRVTTGVAPDGPCAAL